MSTKIESNQSPPIISSIVSIGVSSGLFGALAYYSGRIYLEGYYQGLNIPVNIVNFDFIECVYSSVRSGTILISLLLAILTYNVIKLLILWESGRNWPALSEMKPINDTDFKQIPKFIPTTRLSRFISSFPIVIYMIIIALLIWTFAIPEGALRNLFQLPLIVVCLIYGLLLTQEGRVKSLFFKLKRKRKKVLRDITASLFICSLIFVIWLSFSAPLAWGQAAGINDWNEPSSRTFHTLPKVYFFISNTDSYPLVSWICASDNICKNEEPLIILLSSDTSLFVRKLNRNSKVIIISRQDILAIQIVDSESK